MIRFPLTLLLVSSVSAETFRHFEEHGASLVVSDGFVEVAPERVPEGLETLFLNGDPDDDIPDMGISVQMLNGTIAPNTHLALSDIPQELRDQGYSVERMKWRNFSIDAIKATVMQSGIKVSSIVVQVPLEPKALQLGFAAPSDRMAELEAIATKTVLSVVGSTNWEGAPLPRKLSTSERVVSGVKGLVQLALVCTVVIFLVRRFRKKKSTSESVDSTDVSNTSPPAP